MKKVTTNMYFNILFFEFLLRHNQCINNEINLINQKLESYLKRISDESNKLKDNPLEFIYISLNKEKYNSKKDEILEYISKFCLENIFFEEENVIFKIDLYTNDIVPGSIFYDTLENFLNKTLYSYDFKFKRGVVSSKETFSFKIKTVPDIFAELTNNFQDYENITKDGHSFLETKNKIDLYCHTYFFCFPKSLNFDILNFMYMNLNNCSKNFNMNKFPVIKFIFSGNRIETPNSITKEYLSHISMTYADFIIHDTISNIINGKSDGKTKLRKNYWNIGKQKKFNQNSMDYITLNVLKNSSNIPLLNNESCKLIYNSECFCYENYDNNCQNEIVEFMYKKSDKGQYMIELKSYFGNLLNKSNIIKVQIDHESKYCEDCKSFVYIYWIENASEYFFDMIKDKENDKNANIKYKKCSKHIKSFREFNQIITQIFDFLKNLENPYQRHLKIYKNSQIKNSYTENFSFVETNGKSEFFKLAEIKNMKYFIKCLKKHSKNEIFSYRYDENSFSSNPFIEKNIFLNKDSNKHSTFIKYEAKKYYNIKRKSNIFLSRFKMEYGHGFILKIYKAENRIDYISVRLTFQPFLVIKIYIHKFFSQILKIFDFEYVKPKFIDKKCDYNYIKILVSQIHINLRKLYKQVCYEIVNFSCNKNMSKRFNLKKLKELCYKNVENTIIKIFSSYLQKLKEKTECLKEIEKNKYIRAQMSKEFIKQFKIAIKLVQKQIGMSFFTIYQLKISKYSVSIDLQLKNNGKIK